MHVGVIKVEEYSEPPVIVSRGSDDLGCETIRIRTPGPSARISAGDLLILLRERDKANQSRLRRSAQRVSEIGSGNALTVGTSAGPLESEDKRVAIARDLADHLEFIKESEVEEVAGAPNTSVVRRRSH